MNDTDGFDDVDGLAAEQPAGVLTAEIDADRLNYARAATHGFGVGRIEAQRYLASLEEQQLQPLREMLTQDVERSQGLAQERDVPVADYLAELVAKGLLVPADRLDLVYRSAFDVGFRAYLAESQMTHQWAALYHDESTPGMGSHNAEAAESRLA